MNKIIADWCPVGNICEVKVIFEDDCGKNRASSVFRNEAFSRYSQHLDYF